jgi:dolichol-phosphate mannosyltransferase
MTAEQTEQTMGRGSTIQPSGINADNKSAPATLSDAAGQKATIPTELDRSQCEDSEVTDEAEVNTEHGSTQTHNR